MIFLDTNVISETFRKRPDERVMRWLERHDDSLALPTVTIGEIAFGIQKLRPDERADRLQAGLDAWRQRFAHRIFPFTEAPFTEAAALAYGELMGSARRRGLGLSAPDGMIAGIAMSNGGSLATRNARDFASLALTLIDPWTA